MVDAKPYADVRALSRGVALLTALNKVGQARAADLAQATDIDRTTTYRLLTTLERSGLIARRPSDGMFVLTAQVRRLSDGYQDRDFLTQRVGHHLGSLFQQVLWPTDFAEFDQGAMVIRETTHRFSPYSVHRGMIGRQRPLFASALGRAFLGAADERQVRTVLEIARGAGPSADVPHAALQAATVRRLQDDYATRGYAWSVGETESHISAIARAIRGPDGVRGAINVVFFRSAMGPAEAAERFLDPLQDCIGRIEADMLSGQPAEDGPALERRYRAIRNQS